MVRKSHDTHTRDIIEGPFPFGENKIIRAEAQTENGPIVYGATRTNSQ